jgi:hypothetical protein
LNFKQANTKNKFCNGFTYYYSQKHEKNNVTNNNKKIIELQKVWEGTIKDVFTSMTLEIDKNSNKFESCNGL